MVLAGSEDVSRNTALLSTSAVYGGDVGRPYGTWAELMEVPTLKCWAILGLSLRDKAARASTRIQSSPEATSTAPTSPHYGYLFVTQPLSFGGGNAQGQSGRGHEVDVGNRHEWRLVTELRLSHACVKHII